MTKKYFKMCVAYFTILFLCLPFLAHAEIIRNFDADILVLPSSKIIVTETIQYDFEAAQRHGIFRDIPTKSTDGPDIYVEPISVVDEQGRSYSFETTDNGSKVSLKIGDADRFVSGLKTYVIQYEVWNAFRAFDTNDELYWNVTGNGWQVPIEKATARVHFDGASMKIADIGFTCFVGAQNSTDTNCGTDSDTVNTTYFTKRLLNPGEGLTIAYKIPRNLVLYTEVGPPFRPSHIILWVLPFFLPILIIGSILFSALNLFRKKKNIFVIPKELKRTPIVVQYNPPEGMRPVDVGTLVDRTVDMEDISSVIVDLAVRGYLTIRAVTTKGVLWGEKKDFEFVKKKGSESLTHPADIGVYGLLFGAGDSILLSALEDDAESSRKIIALIQKQTNDYIISTNYFVRKKYKKSEWFKSLLGIIAGFAIVGILGSRIFPGFFNGSLFIIFIVLGIDGIIYALTPRIALSEKGTQALLHSMGFRDYLNLVEKDRLALLNAPALSPEIFEKFLPYAMVLGVEEKWAEKFKGIYTTAPGWYQDPTMGNFNAVLFAHSLHSFGSSFVDASNRAAATGHSSGSGGGGFSGGGSGGGGGGSW